MSRAIPDRLVSSVPGPDEPITDGRSAPTVCIELQNNGFRWDDQIADVLQYFGSEQITEHRLLLLVEEPVKHNPKVNVGRIDIEHPMLGERDSDVGRLHLAG